MVPNYKIKQGVMNRRPENFLSLVTCFWFLNPISHAEGTARKRGVLSWRFRLFVIIFLLVYVLVASAQENTGGETEQLARQILELNRLGKYFEAVPLAQRLVEITKRALGEGHPDYATSLNTLAFLYDMQGKYAEAEPLYKLCLTIREKVLGQDHLVVAFSLNNLAALYSKQGKYDAAEPLYKRCLQIREKALRPDHVDVATSLNNLALLYWNQSRYTEAEPLYKRSLAILEKALGPDSPAVALCLNNIGALYFKQGKYPEAEPLLKRALAIEERVLGPVHPQVALGLMNLADFYTFQAKYTEAEQLYKRSLEIREKVLGPDHPDVASCLNALGELYRTLGKYDKAEPLYKRSLAIREKALGPNHPDVAASLNNLALMYSGQGKEVEAEPLYKRSLAIIEKALGPDHPDVARGLNNLAGISNALGQLVEAESLYKRSLAIREKALGPNHPDVANSLGNLAFLYLRWGRYVEAEPLFKQALVIWEKTLGPDHPVVAYIINNLGQLYCNQGRYAEAEPLFHRSLSVREKILGPESPDVALSLNNLAGLYCLQGKYPEAEPLLNRGLAIWEKVLGPGHPFVAISLNNLAMIYWNENKHAKAELFFERYLQNLSKQFEHNFNYMSEKDRLQFLDTVSLNFPLYFSFCMNCRNELPTLKGRMYDVVLWKKGLIALSIAALRAKIQAGGKPEALRLLDRLTEKKSELAKLASLSAESNPPSRKAWRGRVEDLEKEVNDLEEELATLSSTLGEEKQLAHATWQQVRDALKPDEAAVEIVNFPFSTGKKWTGTSYYVALVLRRDSREPEFVVLGGQNELEKIPFLDYRRLVAPPDPTRPVGLGHKFYTAFWKPLEGKLGKARRVYVSPDGELNQVAFGVVPGKNGRLLMDIYELRIVNSTKDLLREGLFPSTGTAVLFGNPKFELSETEQRAVLKSAKLEKPNAAVALGVTALRSRDLGGEALGEIKGTQQEVEDLSTMLKHQGWSVQIFTGEEALEERVKGVCRPRTLHLATHGFFEKDQPRQLSEWGLDKRVTSLEDPMLRSGLYLAGANRVLRGEAPAPDLEDGVLTAYEASQLNLQGTELVVLSACETGLGKTVTGEGVFGLRRALQVAGAEAVLMSLWSVPDKETRGLMMMFYEKWLGGMEKHRALREAQQEMRKKVRGRGGQDEPFFWGAFVLVGQ